MLLAILTFVATILTYALFRTKSPMLGFPSAMFFALAGGQAYTLSTATWDIYFLFAFACLLGMTTFCAFGAYGLREKRDTIGDEEMEKGDSGLATSDSISDLEKDTEQPQTRARTGTRRSKSKRRREFDF